MSWSSVNLADTSVVQSLRAIQDGIVPVIDSVATVLNAAKALAEAVVNFLLVATDVEALALKAAIDVVRALLKDLQGGTGCYYLAIPIRAINTTPDQALIYAPEPAGFQSIPEQFLPPVSGKSGGNYGFYQDVAASLADELDMLRPTFTSEAYVAGVFVVAGSSSYLNMIPLINKLRALLSGATLSGAGEGLSDLSFPHTQELRASIVPRAVTGSELAINRLVGGGEQPYSVKLEWKRVDRVITNTDFGVPTTHTIKRVGVYRRSDAPFPTMVQDIAENKYGEYTQIALFDYDGWTHTAYDDTATPGETYYYGVGYEIESTSASDETISITYPIDTFATTSISLPADMNILPRTGVPPDWVMLPSPLSLIPDIRTFVDTVNLFLDTLEKRVDDTQAQYRKYITDISAEVQRYITLSQQITQTIRQIVELMTLPDVYIGAYPFAGRGGNQFMLNTLGRALNGDDSGRPPFDNGDEIVTGFILYTGASTPGALTAFSNMIETLFGGSGAAASAYKTASDSLGTVIASVDQQITFLENLDKSPTPITEEEVPKGIGPDLEPSTEQYEPQESVP